MPDSSQVSYEPLRSFVCSALQIPELTVGYQHWALACFGYASLLELSAVAELSEGTGPEVEIPQILADAPCTTLLLAARWLVCMLARCASLGW